MNNASNQTPHPSPSFAGHYRIARVDHWVKNVFVLPGFIAAFSLSGVPLAIDLIGRLTLGMLAIGLVASSNYTLNEVVDAASDKHHPTKRFRPVPAGQVSVPLAYGQWLALGVAGVVLGYSIAPAFAWTLVALWIMSCAYNIPPVRTKDLPYLDVLTEAINNPLRLMAGWYIVTTLTNPPGSLLLSYWMVGCYFMAIKRYAECRQIGDREQIARYRKSLAAFTPEKLLVGIMFYGSASMLFFGAFIMRYRLELILGFPFVALVMAQYLALGFEEDSPAQNPEKLYRSKKLMVSVVAASIVTIALLVVDLPFMYEVFSPEFERQP